MISVVNGYVCSSSCDVEAAKKGKDPSAPPGAPPGTPGKTSGFDQQPATVLDGALKELATANTVTAASASPPASADVQPPKLNLLA